MNVVFFVFMSACLLFLLARRRRADAFMLSFVSMFIYFLPGFFGYCVYPVAGGGFVEVQLDDTAYAVLVLVASSAVFFSLINDAVVRKLPIRTTFPSEDKLAPIMAFGIALSLGLAVIDGGEALFSPDKREVLAAEGRWLILNVLLSMFGLVYSAALVRSRTLLILSVSSLAFNVFIGHRSNAALAIIAAALAILMRGDPGRIVFQHWRKAFLVLPLAAAFFVYKYVYVAVKAGMLDLVIMQLSDAEFYSQAIMLSEPFFTMSILDAVVKHDFISDPQLVYNSFLLFVPFLDGFFDESFFSFNEAFQGRLFPGVEHGMAANMWAQAYSVGGLLGVLVFCLAHNLILMALNRFVMSRSPIIATMGSVSAAFWGFYIHRNDVAFMFNIEKRIAYVALLLALVATGISVLRGRKLGARLSGYRRV